MAALVLVTVALIWLLNRDIVAGCTSVAVISNIVAGDTDWLVTLSAFRATQM